LYGLAVVQHAKLLIVSAEPAARRHLSTGPPSREVGLPGLRCAAITVGATRWSWPRSGRQGAAAPRGMRWESTGVMVAARTITVCTRSGTDGRPHAVADRFSVGTPCDGAIQVSRPRPPRSTIGPGQQAAERGQQGTVSRLEAGRGCWRPRTASWVQSADQGGCGTRSCQVSAGIPSTFPPPVARPRGTGRNWRDAEGWRKLSTDRLCTSRAIAGARWGWGRDLRGDGGATCKIAGVAYTGSNPVPATAALTSNNAVLGRPIRSGSRAEFPSTFPPPDAQPTPLTQRALRAEHSFDHPSQAGRGLGQLVDAHPLGERATVGVAQLGGDDAGRLLLGRHRRRQGMA
jgi:hypothetical protein